MQIHSIFESISGEAGPVIRQGEWTTFIRLQGCNCHCLYCDTKETQETTGGIEMTVDEILRRCYTKNVLLTGGEPFIWKQTPDLIDTLHRNGHIVQVETNGTFLDLPAMKGIGYCIDIKCPCSGMQQRMPSPKALFYRPLWMNVPVYLKFVVAEKDDLKFTLPYITAFIGYNMADTKDRFVISPIDGDEYKAPKIVADAIEMIRDVHPAALEKMVISLQIHKILGMD